MNILLTGASGQLGQELLPQLRQLGTVTLVDRAAGQGNDKTLQMDLANLEHVENLLNRVRPDLIVNAAAYTAVDLAEDDSTTAFRVNAELPGRLAQWSEQNGGLLLHYSTDYVFDGNSARPFTEQDLTGPLGVYGESKLAGEWAIAASNCRHTILRTSWVYSSHGNNFVLTMLRLARDRPALSIVSDQTGCPTWARNLAGVSRQVISRMSADKDGTGPQGLYHYCDDKAVSWYEFASAIFSAATSAGYLSKMPELTAVPSVEFPQKACRPMYSVLDTSKIRRELGIEPASFDQALQRCIEEIVENE